MEKHQLTSQKYMWENKIGTYSNGITMVHVLCAKGNQSWARSGRFHMHVYIVKGIFDSAGFPSYHLIVPKVACPVVLYFG